MTSWVCANCGATYDEKTSPCLKCASERLARLEDDTSSEPSMRATDVEYRCTECGAAHIKNSPPCNRCGNMTFEAVYDNTDSTNEAAQSADDTEQTRSITLRSLAAYGAGIIGILNLTAALLYLSIVPAILHVVAIYSVFPPARRQLARRYNIEFSTPAAVTLFFLTAIAGNLIFVLTQQ